MEFINIWGLGAILLAAVLHFSLGFAAAWLVSYWILTMLSRTTGCIYLPKERISGLSIYGHLLSLCVSLSLVLHVLEDYTLNWF
jgi:hypothetical protein